VSEQAASYRRILKSSSVVGGASVLNAVISLVRTKVLAVLIGPVGIGLISLYRALLTTGTTVGMMGLDIVGTRQIAEAEASGEARGLAVARRALLWSSVALALLSGLVMFALRGQIAAYVLGARSQAWVVAWLALGLALSIGAAAQAALIQGMRRIGDIARVTLYGGLLNTAAGIALVWRWRMHGLVFYILVMPVANFLLGGWYCRQIPRPGHWPIAAAEMARHWRMLLTVGAPFMGGAVATAAVQLWLRVDVTHALGASALGQFQASYAVTQQYLALVLAAMAADYYPRLTGVFRDHAAAVRLVNEQTEIALLLSGPILLGMMALAPWVVRLLYTAQFAPAAGILRWQVLADVLKLAAWPLGFVFLAAGDGKTFFWTELASLLVIVAVVAVFLRGYGLDVTGVAYLACYFVYLPLIYWRARRRIGFRWHAPVARLLAALFGLTVVVGVAAHFSWWGQALGCVAAAGFTVFALQRLSHKSDLGGPLATLSGLIRRVRRGE
jgi:O-antigen/teichoic acid export membrane protein